ncbi:hypothetical protein F5888DRAFT_1637214 [Russula emetica]|nr:hypothetical protein F5888DRAFT_1637214 [Russula emetica]
MPLVTIIARGGLLVQPTRHTQQILTAQTTYSPTFPLVEHRLLLVAVKHSGTLLFFEDKLAIEMTQRGPPDHWWLNNRAWTSRIPAYKYLYMYMRRYGGSSADLRRNEGPPERGKTAFLAELGKRAYTMAINRTRNMRFRECPGLQARPSVLLCFCEQVVMVHRQCGSGLPFQELQDGGHVPLSDQVNSACDEVRKYTPKKRWRSEASEEFELDGAKPGTGECSGGYRTAITTPIHTEAIPAHASSCRSPILRGIHYSGNGPIIKDIVTYGRQNATNPGLMRMARHHRGDAPSLPPLPPRCKLNWIDQLAWAGTRLWPTAIRRGAGYVATVGGKKGGSKPVRDPTLQ